MRVSFGILLLTLLLAGCGNLSESLSSAVLNQREPLVIRDGLPAYLILLDSLVESDPDDEDTLKAAANLYLLYGSTFVDTRERSAVLIGRARNYAERAFCEEESTACGWSKRDLAQIDRFLQSLDEDEVPFLFTATASWLAWVQANSNDWNALADLPKIEHALARVIELDERYMDGSAHIYLGILKALRPPALGGKPEEARAHFERAIEISKGVNLGAKVEYARRYARSIYDRDLHDRLLNEVVAADPVVAGRTLMNTLAQRAAVELLASAEDYF